jgi:hypothetical protein
MVGHPDRKGIKPSRNNRGRPGRCRYDKGEGAGHQVFNQGQKVFTSRWKEAAHLHTVGEVNDQRVVGRTVFGLEYPLDRQRVNCRCAQAVHRLCGKHDEAAARHNLSCLVCFLSREKAGIRL